MNLIIIKILLLPFILIITGIIFLLFPPKEINNIYGFRTKASSRSIITWEYANKRTGQLLLIMGIILSCISLLLFFLEIIDFTRVLDIVAYSGIIILGIVIIIVQLELINKFDKDGNILE